MENQTALPIYEREEGARWGEGARGNMQSKHRSQADKTADAITLRSRRHERRPKAAAVAKAAAAVWTAVYRQPSNW